MAGTKQVTIRAAEKVDNMFRVLTSNSPDDSVAREILANALVRRLNTRKGYFWTDPQYGYMVSDTINEGMTAETIGRIPYQIQQEIEKDERVQACTVEVVSIGGPFDARKMVVDLTVVPNRVGPFSLTLGISEVNTQVMQGRV